MLNLLSYLGCHPGQRCWILELPDQAMLNIFTCFGDYREKRDLALVCRRFNEIVHHPVSWNRGKALCVDIGYVQRETTVSSYTKYVPVLSYYCNSYHTGISRMIFGHRVKSATDLLRHIQFVLDKFRRLETITLNTDAGTNPVKRELLSAEREALRTIERNLIGGKLHQITVHLCPHSALLGGNEELVLPLLLKHSTVLQHLAVHVLNDVEQNAHLTFMAQLLPLMHKFTRLESLVLPKVPLSLVPDLEQSLIPLKCVNQLSMIKTCFNQPVHWHLLNALPATNLTKLSLTVQPRTSDTVPVWQLIMSPPLLTNLTDLSISIDLLDIKLASFLKPIPLKFERLRRFAVNVNPEASWLYILHGLDVVVEEWLDLMPIERVLTLVVVLHELYEQVKPNYTERCEQAMSHSTRLVVKHLHDAVHDTQFVQMGINPFGPTVTMMLEQNMQ